MAGVKHDNGKPRLGLLDRVALEAIARVLAHGAEKYRDAPGGAHNWRHGLALSRELDAALRHIHAFNDGDPESGLSHIAHAACCLMFVLRLHAERPDCDDRFRP